MRNNLWQWVKRPDDPWAIFFGVMLVLSCLVSVAAFYAVGWLGAGRYDDVTQSAVREVSYVTIPALLLLGPVSSFAITGSWSPGYFFYAGVTFQVLFLAKE